MPSIAGPSIAADAQGGSGFAPVAHAASSKSGIVPSDVTVAGVFDKDGKPQPQPWTVDSVDMLTQSYIEYTIDVKNAKPGDKLFLRPQITAPNTQWDFSANDWKRGDMITDSWFGLRHMGNVQDRTLTLGGQTVATYMIEHGGSAIITFTDAAEDVKDGTVTLQVPAQNWTWYNSTGGQQQRTTTLENIAQMLRVTVYPGGDAKAAKEATRKIGTSNVRVIAAESDRDYFRFYDSPSVLDLNNYTVSLKTGVLLMPIGANGTSELTVNPGGKSLHNGKYVSLQGAFVPDVVFTYGLKVYGTDPSQREYWAGEEKKLEDFPGAKIEAKQIDGGKIFVTTSGIPANAKPMVRLRSKDSQEYGIASYAPYGMINMAMKFTDTHGKVRESSHNTTNALPALPGDPVVEGNVYNRAGTVQASIDGLDVSAGVNNAASIAGTTQQFRFTVKNTGDALLAAPLVTLPDGKTVQPKGVKIQPGDTGSFTVSYAVPENATTLKFDMQMSNAKLEGVPQVFSVRKAPDALAQRINPDEYWNTPITAPIGQITTAKPKKKLPAGTTLSVTPQTPSYVQIGRDGTLTITPDGTAREGSQDIVVTARHKDGSTQKVVIPMTVTPLDVNAAQCTKDTDGDGVNDCQERVDGTDPENNKDYKGATEDRLDKIDGRIGDLNNSINDLIKGSKDQAEQLKKQADELAKQSGILQDQAKTLGNIQKGITDGNALAQQSNKLAKKANELAQKNNELASTANDLSKQGNELAAKANTIAEQSRDVLKQQQAELKRQADAAQAQVNKLQQLADATDAQTKQLTKAMQDGNKAVMEQLQHQAAQQQRLADEAVKQSKALQDANAQALARHKDQLAHWQREQEQWKTANEQFAKMLAAFDAQYKQQEQRNKDDAKRFEQDQAREREQFDQQRAQWEAQRTQWEKESADRAAQLKQQQAQFEQQMEAQRKQWATENEREVARDQRAQERDKRQDDQWAYERSQDRYNKTFQRCMTTNAGMGLAALLPLGAVGLASTPAGQDALRNGNIALQKQLGIYNDDVARQYGHLIGSVGGGIAGIAALVATLALLNGFVNDCYTQADTAETTGEFDRSERGFKRSFGWLQSRLGGSAAGKDAAEVK